MFSRKTKYSSMDIAFYKEAAHHGEHGQLEVSSRREGLRHQAVAFAFKSMTELPDLTPELMQFIWEEAKVQGYVAHKLISYGQQIGQARVTTSHLQDNDVGAGTVEVTPFAPIPGIPGQRQGPIGFKETQVGPFYHELDHQKTGQNPVSTTGLRPVSSFHQQTGSSRPLGVLTNSNSLQPKNLCMETAAPDNDPVGTPVWDLVGNCYRIRSGDDTSLEVTWGSAKIGTVLAKINDKEQCGYNVRDILKEGDLYFNDVSLYITAKSAVTLIESYVAGTQVAPDAKVVLSFVMDVARNDLTSEERAEFDRMYEELVERGAI